jgi:hypothetical protein
MSENVFTMAGDVGDAVYAMCAVQGLGGGHLVFWPRGYVREPMTPEKVDRIAGFFATQPYIRTVRFKTHETPSVNLDDFRAKWMQLRPTGAHAQYNLCELFLLTFSLPMALANDAWLTIPDPQYKWVCTPPVIFSRSFRYRNHRFPWKAVWQKYKTDAAFLGTENEWLEFCETVGKVPHVETLTLLEAACLIAKCKLFVGNQSALYSIAEGLKMPRVLEVWRQEPNCCFPGAVLGFDESVQLPDL